MSVKAGDTVGFRVDGNVTHPGPLQFYMAKAPEGETAKTFQGDGDVWFKIFNDDPNFTESWPWWPNEGSHQVFVTIPSCIAEGEYLLRVEHIALHNSKEVGGAQFYVGCAQLHVTSGGTKTFPGVSFPGEYSVSLLFHIVILLLFRSRYGANVDPPRLLTLAFCLISTGQFLLLTLYQDLLLYPAKTHPSCEYENGLHEYQ